MNGTPEISPLKMGAAAVDFSTGTTGAFAIASALFQRERTGRGQRIDLAMFDSALMLAPQHLTAFLHDGSVPKPHGNGHRFATNRAYETSDGLIVIAATNPKQQQRLWEAMGCPDLASSDRSARRRDVAKHIEVLTELFELARPWNGNTICRPVMSRRPASRHWLRRLIAAGFRRGVSSIVMVSSQASRGASPCRWPASSLITVVPASKRPRLGSAKTPPPSWASWAIGMRTSPAFTPRASSPCLSRIMLLLRPDDIRGLITMSEAVGAVELGFREWSDDRELNQPRRRVHVPSGVRVSVHQGASPQAGLSGLCALASR